MIAGFHALPVIMVLVAALRSSGRQGARCGDCHAFDGIFIAVGLIATAASLVVCIGLLAVLVSAGLRRPAVAGFVALVPGISLAFLTLAALLPW